MDSSSSSSQTDSSSSSPLSSLLSLSLLLSYQSHIRIFLLSTFLDLTRRLLSFLIDRSAFLIDSFTSYSITAQFTEGDAAYEWIVLLLNHLEVYQRAKEFRVAAASGVVRWSRGANGNASSGESASGTESGKGNRKNGGFIKTGIESLSDGLASYTPTYQLPQLFIYRSRYLVEIKRYKEPTLYHLPPSLSDSSSSPYGAGGTLFLTIYTRDMSVLSSLIDQAKSLYTTSAKPHVIVHTADQPSFGPIFNWSKGKRKLRRPLGSIILPSGVMKSLMEDVKEFMRTEGWYTKAGIPHRRGYLLYGPPGTGKTSTIYALAGELGLEIYSVSLASSFVDDSYLHRAVSSIPKQSIFLIEDIDCAFPPRDPPPSSSSSSPNSNSHGEARRPPLPHPFASMSFPPPHFGSYPSHPDPSRSRSNVTLSGLLNVLDGVGSEEGKMFFATTNHLEMLDAALMRPGRIDRKVEYHLASREQAEGLFVRFFPVEHVCWDGEEERREWERRESEIEKGGEEELDREDDGREATSINEIEDKQSLVQTLAQTFASHIPPDEFSTAQLQGYLLAYKRRPFAASSNIASWVQKERKEKEDLEEKARRRRDGPLPVPVPETSIEEEMSFPNGVSIPPPTTMAMGAPPSLPTSPPGNLQTLLLNLTSSLFALQTHLATVPSTSPPIVSSSSSTEKSQVDSKRESKREVEVEHEHESEDKPIGPPSLVFSSSSSRSSSPFSSSSPPSEVEYEPNESASNGKGERKSLPIAVEGGFSRSISQSQTTPVAIQTRAFGQQRWIKGGIGIGRAHGLGCEDDVHVDIDEGVREGDLGLERGGVSMDQEVGKEGKGAKVKVEYGTLTILNKPQPNFKSKPMRTSTPASIEPSPTSSASSSPTIPPPPASDYIASSLSSSISASTSTRSTSTSTSTPTPTATRTRTRTHLTSGLGPRPSAPISTSSSIISTSVVPTPPPQPQPQPQFAPRTVTAASYSGRTPGRTRSRSASLSSSTTTHSPLSKQKIPPVPAPKPPSLTSQSIGTSARESISLNQTLRMRGGPAVNDNEPLDWWR